MSTHGYKTVVAVMALGVVVLVACLFYDQMVITQQAQELRTQLQLILHGCR